MDEIQADLLVAAKREVINELFGEMIVAFISVENFVVTSDRIRTSSIGFTRYMFYFTDCGAITIGVFASTWASQMSVVAE